MKYYIHGDRRLRSIIEDDGSHYIHLSQGGDVYKKDTSNTKVVGRDYESVPRLWLTLRGLG